MFRPILTLLLLLAACDGGDKPADPKPEAPAEAAPEAEPEAVPAADARVPEGAKVMFVEPADGATLKSPFKVVFGVEGMEVEAAGEVHANKGHHHILIGHPDGVADGTTVPKDDTHIHYGDGSTETELTLDPGEYTLTLQFADGAHSSYGPKMASTIKVVVE